MCTFFTTGGGDSEFTKFTGPTLDAFLKARSQNVSGDQQELVARAIGWQKTYVFHELAIFWLAEKRCRLLPLFSSFFILHHLSPVIFANATIMAFLLLHNSTFNFHCYTQCEACLLYTSPSPRDGV